MTPLFSKIVHGLKIYEANQGVPHPSLSIDLEAQNGFDKRSKGDVPLLTFEDTFWYGKISVGAPPKDFHVDFDTGSTGIILPGPNCTDVNCQGHTVFNPK